MPFESDDYNERRNEEKLLMLKMRISLGNPIKTCQEKT